MENASRAELSAQLDGFFALNMDLLSITDTEFRFVRVNQAWADFLGIPVAELTGRCYLDFIHPQDIATTHRGLEQILRESELVRFVNRYRYHTGEYRSIEWSARQIGNLVHSVARDISSHIEYQANLIRRADFEAMLYSLSSLLMNANDESFDSMFPTILKELGAHIRCEKILITRYPRDSSKMQRIYSWSKQGEINQLIQQVETPSQDIAEFTERMCVGEEILIEQVEHLPECWNTLKELLSSQDMPTSNIIPISCGGVCYGFLAFQIAENNLTLMREERGILRFFTRDLGQMLKRMEQDQALRIALARQKAMLEETVSLNREIEYYMAKLSHDVRTAVYSILGFNRMLLDTELDSIQKHYANLIGNSSDFLHSLVSNVVDFSSIKAGKVEVRSIDFSLKDLVNSCIANFSLQAEEKDLSVFAEVDVCIPPIVRGDPDQLARVLTNLIGNAIQNTSQGSVRVQCGMQELHKDGLRVTIVVSDTGCGIPPEEVERIFQPYRQAHPTGPAAKIGSGLGLPICSCLMEAMQGTIAVSSEVGMGSTFTVALPLELESKEDAFQAEADNCIPPAIVYDTNLTSRQHLVDLLRSMGVSVLIADTPHAVARLVQAPIVQEHRTVQLYFSIDSDDGDIYEELLNLRNGTDVDTRKLIYLMASSYSPAQLQCFMPLVDGFLLKPIQVRRITDLIRSGCTCLLSKSPAPIPEMLVRTDAQRVLVVDDFRINQEIVVYLLEQLGLVVETADDGEQALEMIAAHDYDLILLDLTLPGLGGAEVARTARAREVSSGERRPIIAMTASVVQGERARCLSIGFDDFLEKPVRSEKLFEVISKWMSSTT